jgi:hypothetical protein
LAPGAGSGFNHQPARVALENGAGLIHKLIPAVSGYLFQGLVDHLDGPIFSHHQKTLMHDLNNIFTVQVKTFGFQFPTP